jgi:membrane-associated phospholipid phosphatase
MIRIFNANYVDTENLKKITPFVLAIVFNLNVGVLFSQVVEQNARSVTASDSVSVSDIDPNPSVNRYAGSLKRVITTGENLVYLGFGTGLGLMFHPLDKEISKTLSGDDSFLMSTFPDNLGSTATILSGAALSYAIGRLANNDNLAETGLLVLEATVTTQFITLAGKYLVQRPRPDGGNNHSFPSGHTSGMFAAASVLDARFGYKAGVPAYLLASFVGYSRIRMEKHYPTDVVCGAILGVIIGRSFGKQDAEGRRIALVPYFNHSSMAANLQIRL